MHTALEHLVDHLSYPLSPALRQAFLTVDRGIFVPAHYRKEGKEWVWEDNTTQAYQDIALITKLENGYPVSSSSMPYVMAAMLDALDLQDGQTVLEIGTGTGYNAALLSKLVGQTGNVISLDIDKELVTRARGYLQRADCLTVMALVADGFAGCPPYAPYDRIIATASFRHVPPTWAEQLHEGGILVGNLLGKLTSILVRLQKQADGSLRGSPVPHGAFFMGMRKPQQEEVKPLDWLPYETQTVEEEHDNILPLASLLKSQAFLLALEAALPTLHMHRRYMGGPPAAPSSFETWLINPQEYSSVAVGTSRIQCRGKRLWNDILKTVHQWETQQQPRIQAYHILISPQGAMRIHL